MSITKSKIEAYHLLKPSRYSLVRKLELIHMTAVPGNQFEMSLILELVPISNSLGAEEALVLSFDGVRKLQLKQADWYVLQLPLIEIRDISSRQWEGVSYEVVDNEDGVLSLMCRDFSASVR